MKKLICIVCPKGCNLTMDKKLNVSGNFCKRGEIYAKTEITNPKRMITSTVIIDSKLIDRLPVKTSNPIPKDKIIDVMNEISKIKVNAPINLGDIVLKNVLNLNVDIVSTRTISH